jgi:Domain of unknown function (DUF4331)
MLRKLSLGLISFLVMIGWDCPFAISADHLDSPSVRVDGSVDINDLYAFQSPVNAANVVFVITVNPFAGVLSGTAFNPAGVYELNIDNNGDAIADVAFRFYFSAVNGGAQRFAVVQGRSVATGRTNQTTQLRGGGSVTAGLFDDPFFFDLNGFNDGLAFKGNDFFAGANVTAIVIEIPRAVLGANNIGVWATTYLRGQQFDRKGRPAINTVLIPSAQKNMFNATQPSTDPVLFGETVRASLIGLGNSSERAASLASVLLPDTLTLNTASSEGFLNGRRLSDDVIDAELTLLTNGVLGDGVNFNDKPFSPVFPYLAPAH